MSYSRVTVAMSRTRSTLPSGALKMMRSPISCSELMLGATCIFRFWCGVDTMPLMVVSP